ncbi:hypothetical protein RKD38_002142 [Streptomyces ambofaciens]
MTGNPRWSSGVRWEIQRAMNAVVREAADIVASQSSNGKWIAPGEIDELGDNPSLGTAGQICDAQAELIQQPVALQLREYARLAFAQHGGHAPRAKDPERLPAVDVVLAGLDDFEAALLKGSSAGGRCAARRDDQCLRSGRCLTVEKTVGQFQPPAVHGNRRCG